MISRTGLTRAVVVLAAMVLGALLFEGVWSLATGRSLLRRAAGRGRLPKIDLDDAERAALAARTEGPFAFDPDPEVRFRMKSSCEREILGAVATTDEWGMRVRVGPTPAADAFRIVVLGDSVAFGYGLRDDQTFAARLEEILAAGMSPRPFVQTVASVGWNGRGTMRYLRNHLGRLRPDLVIHIPYTNDLDDAVRVNEVGHMERSGSFEDGPFTPFICLESYGQFMFGMFERMPRNRLVELGLTGDPDLVAPAQSTRITPYSRRRWSILEEAYADTIRRVEAQGGHFVAFTLFGDRSNGLFAEALLRVRGDLMVESLMARPMDKDTLDGGHPTAERVEQGARLMARRLAEKGLLPGLDPAKLPPVAPEFLARGGAPFDANRNTQELDRFRAELAGYMGRRIDLATGEGFRQIYGGLQLDGTVGKAAFFTLHSGGDRIGIEVRALGPESAIDPVAVTAWIDQVPIGVRALPAAGRAGETLRLEFPIPEELRDETWLDVRLTTDQHVIEVADGKSRMAAFRLLSAEVH